MWMPFTLTGTEGSCFVGVLGPYLATADIITAKAAALGLFGGISREEERGKNPENPVSLGPPFMDPQTKKNSFGAISVCM